MKRPAHLMALSVWCVAVTTTTAATDSAWASVPYGPPKYTVVDLSVPAGTEGAEATSINDNNQIVGPTYVSRYSSYFFWDNGYQPSGGGIKINEFGRTIANWYGPDTNSASTAYRGVSTDLGYLAPVDFNGSIGRTRATDLNNAAQIVGSSAVTPDDEHAFLWQSGVMYDLGTLGGDDSEARDINENGDVVGSSQTPSGAYHAFLRSAGHMIDLGTLGGDYSVATSVNDRGEVAGVSTTADGARHAFRWSHGVMRNLGGEVGYTVVELNERGQVLVGHGNGNGNGHGNGNGDGGRAYLWDNGRKTYIDGLASRAAWPTALNDRGQVVGALRGPEEYDQRAFVWEAGKTVDLGTLGGRYNTATDINEAGVVVGSAGHADGYRHPVMWRPDDGPRIQQPSP